MIRSFYLTFTLSMFAAAYSAADAQTDDKKGEINARSVSKTLRHQMDLPPKSGWDDFQLRIVDDIDKNAYASVAGWEDWGDEKPTPYVKLTRTYLAAFKDNQDALALLLAHELARLKLGHVAPKGVAVPNGGACTMRRLATQADLYAGTLLLRSGYSLNTAVKGINPVLGKMSENTRLTWLERLSRLEVWRLGSDEPWRLTPAFQTGLMFLAMEDYSRAASCFENITREFSMAQQAWIYLGFARFNLRCLSRNKLQKKLDREQQAIAVVSGKAVKLDDDLDDLLSQFGNANQVTEVVPRSGLRRHHFATHGMYALTSLSEELVAVFLISKELLVKLPDAKGKPPIELRPGMSRKKAEELLAGSERVLHPYLPEISSHAYYPMWELVLYYDGEGPNAAVSSIVIGKGSSGK